MLLVPLTKCTEFPFSCMMRSLKGRSTLPSRFLFILSLCTWKAEGNPAEVVSYTTKDNANIGWQNELNNCKQIEISCINLHIHHCVTQLCPAFSGPDDDSYLILIFGVLAPGFHTQLSCFMSHQCYVLEHKFIGGFTFDRYCVLNSRSVYFQEIRKCSLTTITHALP